MTDVKKARVIAKGAFTRAVNSLKTAIDNEELTNTIEKRYAVLKTAWNEAQARNEEYLATLDEEQLCADNWIDVLCQTFDEIEIKADKHLQRVKTSQVNTAEEAKQKEYEESISFARTMREKEKRKYDAAADQLKVTLNEIPGIGDCKESHVKLLKSALTKQKEMLLACERANNEYITTIKSARDKELEISWELELHKNSMELENKVNKCLFEIEEKVTQSSSEKRSRSQASVCMEKIKFDVFDGNIRKYPRFREEFKKHIKPFYSNEDEAFVLRSYLTEETKSEIENLGENIDEIWNRLDQKYGSQRKLIEVIMNDIKQLRPGRQDSPEKSLRMINTIEKAYNDLKRMGHEHQINNAVIISKIEEIMPQDMKQEWIKTVVTEDNNSFENDEFKKLLKFLLLYKRRIEYEEGELRKTTIFSSVHFTSESSNARDSNYNKRPWCWLHANQTEHPIWKCKVFLDMSPVDRMKAVRDNQACYSCLLQQHTVRNCQRGFKCKVEGCGSAHHYLLHDPNVNGQTLHTNATGKEVFLQMQKISAGNGVQRQQNINVLWDSGSTVSLITFKMAKELQLKGKSVKLEIEKIGSTKEVIDSKKYRLVLTSLSGKNTEIEVIGISKISTNLVLAKLDEVKKHFPDIYPADYKGAESGEVDCLIGLDYASLHPQKVCSKDNLLVLENDFGVTVGGSHYRNEYRKDDVIRNASTNFAKTSSWEDFHSIEQLGIDCEPKCGNCQCGTCHLGGKQMSIKDEKEATLIESNLSYDQNEKVWTAGYPWIKDPNVLQDNKLFVLKSLESMERRLLKNEEKAVMYQQQMEDMLRRNVCREVKKDELDLYTGAKYFIAHHAVYKPDSKSTPVRIVFNTSAVFRGIALNDCYAKGPDMLNSLFSVLLRFRENKFAFAADISKMYHTIRIPLADQMTHLFLWRDLNLNIDPRVYAMTRLNFGDKPSGAIALIVLKKTAEMNSHISEKASAMIRHNTYMDDILNSVDTIEDAKEIILGASEILGNGGFQVKEWITSFEAKDSAQTVNALGTCWKPNEDTLMCKIPDLEPKEEKEKGFTKRMVMSQVSSVFDPLGLVGPIVVKAKIFLRKLWTIKIGWDSELPVELQKEWINIQRALKETADFKIPRWMGTENIIGQPMLVLFYDASENAYGTVAYVRWQISCNGFKSMLIASKNRVAPLKRVDIVRLELSGALLSKRLRCFIERESKYKFQKVYHIGDSEIVTAMIPKESYGFNTFVANRIGEIQRGTSVNEWYWISGEKNVADFLTRGKSVADIGRNSTWQLGPNFLTLPEKQWPIERNSSEISLPEMKKTKVNLVNQKNKAGETLHQRIDIERFSQLNKLLGVTARILKLYTVFSARMKNENESLSKIVPKDIEKAEQFWIINAQVDLNIDQSDSSIMQLSPKKIGDVVHVGGRVERWNNMTWDNNEFILLPKGHRLSYLLVKKAHEDVGHLRKEATVAFVRKRFWIIGVSHIAKQVCGECIHCKKKNKLKHTQIMSSLPIERLKPSPPFDATGIDYFGPFEIKGEVQQRTRGKCYGLIFTCFASRAIYADLAQDYSLDSLLQAIRRFGSRHGWPRKIFSDCGTQLIAASKEVTHAVNGFKENDIQSFCRKFGTEWKFSPPDAPWMNGTTECMVKAIKKALQCTIGAQVLKFSELLTVMYECSELVNRRPIGILPHDVDDGRYLCPNDILLGRSSCMAPQGPFEENARLQKRFLFIQTLVNEFWKKWTSSFFPSLVLRRKWHHAHRNMEKDDIVIIKDSNSLRDQWKIGRITRVFPSEDKVVRRVLVKYAIKNLQKDGSYRTIEVERAAHNLIVLVPAQKDTSNVNAGAGV